MEESEKNVPHEYSDINVYVKGVVESLLFVNEKPITLDQFQNVLEIIPREDIKKALDDLKEEYEQQKSGMTLVEISHGYQMLSSSHYKEYIRKFYQTKHKEKLSKPALESLAIIAYKQPVTRADVEGIRGVNSDGVVNHLLHKELIRVIGRKEVAGRPFLYAVTKQFLEYFGLKSLEDLPTLEEFPMLMGEVNMNLKDGDDVDKEKEQVPDEENVSGDQPEPNLEQSDKMDESIAEEYLQENRNILEPDQVGHIKSLQPAVVVDDAQEVLRVADQDTKSVNTEDSEKQEKDDEGED